MMLFKINKTYFTGSADNPNRLIDELKTGLSLYGFYLIDEKPLQLRFKKRVRQYQLPKRSRFEGIGIVKDLEVKLNLKESKILCTVKLEFLIFFATLCALMGGLMHHFIARFGYSFLTAVLIAILVYFLGRWYVSDKIDRIIREII